MLPSTSELNSSRKVALITGITGQVSFHCHSIKNIKIWKNSFCLLFWPAIKNLIFY